MAAMVFYVPWELAMHSVAKRQKIIHVSPVALRGDLHGQHPVHQDEQRIFNTMATSHDGSDHGRRGNTRIRMVFRERICYTKYNQLHIVNMNIYLDFLKHMLLSLSG